MVCRVSKVGDISYHDEDNLASWSRTTVTLRSAISLSSVLHLLRLQSSFPQSRSQLFDLASRVCS